MNGHNEDSLPAAYTGGEVDVPGYSGGYRYTADSYAEPESDEIRRLISALRDKVWWLVIATVLGGAIGLAYSRTQPIAYRSTASVWVDSPSPMGPIQAQPAMRGAGWMQVFISQAVIEPVIRQFRLHVVQQRPPGPGTILDNLEVTRDLQAGRYQIALVGSDRYQLLNMADEVLEEGLIADGVGSSRGFHWVPDATALAAFEEPLVFAVRNPQQAARNFVGRMAVRFDDVAMIIHTELTWPRAAEGAQIHNALIQSYIETTTRLTQGRLNEEVEILREQTEYAASQLRAAELALEEFRVDAITKPGEPQTVQLPGGVVAQDPVFGSFYQQQADLDQIDADLAELDAILESGEGGTLNVLRLRLVPSIQNSPGISATIGSLDQLELDERTLLYTYTHEYPEVVEKSNQIRDIHQVQLPALIRELQADLRNRRSVLRDQIARRAEQLRQIPVRTIQQARLQRHAASAENLHNSLLGNLNRAELAQQTALTSIRELDSAFTPGRPLARTLPAFFVLLGSAVGLGVAMGGVLVRDRLDQRIRHPDDISGKFGLPLLGVVPQLKSPDSNRAAAAVAVESFRSIRTQLSHAHGGAGGLVLITSSTPREGKSVVAANLAISYASAGRRTLLIDADVRRGRLHAVFNFPRSPGLTEHLAGGATLAEAIRRHDSADLDIICSGALSSDAELIGGDRLGAFLAEAQKSYDVVVLDGPPLAAGADALILGQRCDKVVMVFRAGATSEGMARSRLGMLGNVDLPIVGAVLNAVPEHAPYYDQYVNYYYYAEAEAS